MDKFNNSGTRSRYDDKKTSVSSSKSGSSPFPFGLHISPDNFSAAWAMSGKAIINSHIVILGYAEKKCAASRIFTDLGIEDRLSGFPPTCQVNGCYKFIHRNTCSLQNHVDVRRQINSPLSVSIHCVSSILYYQAYLKA